MHDMLLQIDTYAEPTLPTAIGQAVEFARVCSSRISALAVHIDIRVPENWLAEKLLSVSQLAQVEENKSLQAGRASLKYFEDVAARAGVLGDSIIARAELHAVGPSVARHARTRDLCIVPLSKRVDSQRSVAEDVIFGSGRPALVFNPDKAALPSGALDRVSLLWDGSRCAARAIADARPLLRAAGDVRVVTFVGEKPSAVPGLAGDLLRHLKLAGVSARVDEARHLGSIGASIDAHISEAAPQLMVMGAYGVSKIKEFVLGGATEYVLNHLKVPVVFAH